MFEKIKQSPQMFAIIVFLFALITRNIDLISALLIYVAAHILLTEKTKHIVACFSIVLIGISIVTGIAQMIGTILLIVNGYNPNWIMFNSGLSFVFLLSQVALIVVYLILENKQDISWLLVAALALPIIGTGLNLLWNRLANVLTNAIQFDTEIFVLRSLNFPISNVYIMVRGILLVFLITKAHYYTESNGEPV